MKYIYETEQCIHIQMNMYSGSHMAYIISCDALRIITVFHTSIQWSPAFLYQWSSKLHPKFLTLPHKVVSCQQGETVRQSAAHFRKYHAPETVGFCNPYFGPFEIKQISVISMCMSQIDWST